MVTNEERQVCERLERLGIAFDRYEHPPIATAEEGDRYWTGIEAMHSKNLFLRNQKGDRHYLLVVVHSKRVDLRSVANQIGDGKLSFASPERLLKHLGVTPGSVSPFGLMNDSGHAVRLFLDRDLETAGRVSFHPNINTATLVLTREDFVRFVRDTGHEMKWVDVSRLKPEA
jgi:Ala-tRNA(Pro) deacylase